MADVINLEDKRRSLKEAEDDDVLCLITIKANGRVVVWISDRVEADEDFHWLHAHVANATHQIVEGGPHNGVG